MCVADHPSSLSAGFLTFAAICLLEVHYVNMSMHYAAFFLGCKNDNFQMKNCDICLIIAPKHRLWVHARTALRQFLQISTLLYFSAKEKEKKSIPL